MGEIADMMLDGTMCECCGEYIGSDIGYPQYCSEQCARDCGAVEVEGVAMTKCGQPRPSKTNCPDCGKLVKKAGLADHRRDVHGVS